MVGVVNSAPVLSTVEEYRDLVENLHAGLVVHAADTRVLLCNARSAELLGLTMDQMLGRAAPDPTWCFRDEDGEPMAVDDYPVTRVQRTRAVVQNLTVGADRADGRRMWALCNAYPVLAADGALRQIVVTFIDITEQREAEDARAELEEQLRQSQRMEAVGQFTGGIAHDFNNLLTAMLGYGEMLIGALDESDDRRRLAEQVQKSALRAAALTRQLLAFSRKQAVEPRDVELNRVVSDMDRLLRRLIGANITAVTRLEPALRIISADPGQLEQVVMNLAVNARDAMPRGGTLTIETANVTQAAGTEGFDAEMASGDYVSLTVTDTGVGMDAATRARVFEPFFTTKPLGKGTGLGLSTVYGIVTQSGGHIRLRSEVGSGATFTVYLPVAKMQPAAGEAPGFSALGVCRGETILVVEDDDAVRGLAAHILRDSGYQVLEAASAAEATRVLVGLDGPLHLLLADVIMLGASGPELAREVRLGRPATRVVFMSGLPAAEVLGPGRVDSHEAFVAKPFMAGALLRKVREVLDAAMSVVA